MNSLQTRRQFMVSGKHLLGGAAIASLARESMASGSGAPGPHFAPRAKRVIYLHMVGGPAQMDLFDYKPVMNGWYDKELPDSVRMGQHGRQPVNLEIEQDRLDVVRTAKEGHLHQNVPGAVDG